MLNWFTSEHFFLYNQSKFPLLHPLSYLFPHGPIKNGLASASLYPTSGRGKWQLFLSLPCPRLTETISAALVCSSLITWWPLLPWLGSGSLAPPGCSKLGPAIPEQEEPHECQAEGSSGFPGAAALCVLLQLSFAPVQGLPAASSSTGTQNSCAELLLGCSVPSVSLSCSCPSEIPSQSLLSTLASVQVRFLIKAAGKRYSL